MGVFSSYAFMGINLLINFILTPVLLSQFGEMEYGNYQTLYAVFSSLNLFDVGFGTMTIRYGAIYHTERDAHEQENTMATLRLLTFLFCGVLTVVGVGLWYMLPLFNSIKMNSAGIALLKPMVISMVLSSLLRIWLSFFCGVINGKDEFFFPNLLQILQIILRCGFIFALGAFRALKFFDVTASETLSLVVVVLILMGYTRVRLGVRMKLHSIDRNLLRNLRATSAAFLAGGVAGFLNERMITIIVSIILNSVMVTYYTIAHTIFYNFAIIGNMISNVYLPKATQLVAQNASAHELEDFWIAPARLQFVLTGAILGGFIVVGQDFLFLWIGDSNWIIWFTCVLLMLANIFTVINGVGSKLIVAEMNHIKIFSNSFLYCALINVGVSIAAYWVGYWAIPVAGFCSITLVYGWYLPHSIKQVFGLNIDRVFRSIFKGILPCILVATGAGYLLSVVIQTSLAGFLIKGTGYILLLSVLLFFWGINQTEKTMLKHISNRWKGKRNG